MAKHKFKEGNSGRPKGSQNRLSKTVKETVLNVFNDLQADPKHNLSEFAKKYPKDFYLIASKLIPTELVGQTTQIIKVLEEEKSNN